MGNADDPLSSFSNHNGVRQLGHYTEYLRSETATVLTIGRRLPLASHTCEGRQCEDRGNVAFSALSRRGTLPNKAVVTEGLLANGCATQQGCVTQLPVLSSEGFARLGLFFFYLCPI